MFLFSRMVIVLSVFLLWGCFESKEIKSSTHFLPGLYVSHTQNPLKGIYEHITENISYTVHDTLRLERDSTFFMQSPGTQIFGKYKVSSDTVYLYYNKMINRKDSIEDYFESITWSSFFRIAENNMLIQEYHMPDSSGDDSETIITQLELVKE